MTIFYEYFTKVQYLALTQQPVDNLPLYIT